MNPQRLMLMQNVKTNSFEVGSGGVPDVTPEDSILSCASSLPKYYYAARLIAMGDDSFSTVKWCCHYLWHAAMAIAERKQWDVPAGAEVYRILSIAAIYEHLHPQWFKNQNHRVMFYNELSHNTGPKNPIHMTIDKWKKKWGERYKDIYNELNEMSNTHLRQMRRKLG